MEGVDYDETFDPVARMESIRIALACQLKFKLYQMDVKNCFLKWAAQRRCLCVLTTRIH